MKNELQTQNFDTLPAQVQKHALEILKVYDAQDIYYSNGEYHFGLFLLDKYPADHRYIGRYYAKDLYTPEERDKNFVEEFGYKQYPSYVERAKRGLR